MKLIAPRFYEDLFNQTTYWNVFPKVTVKKILTFEAKQWLVKEINHKEIKEALFQMNPDKAPGPYGFNAYFYQHNWSLIKDDVILAVKSFFSSGISSGSLPVKYLGLPLSISYPKAKDFLPLIDKVRKKIEGWMTYSLSFAGRIELIKSVLFSTIAYWYFVYKLPNSTVRSLESIFANFLWKGKLHAINWKDICRPKQEGGFGLRKLNDLCLAAALKLIWRLLSTSTLWSNWMRARYVRGGNFWDTPAHALDSGTWKFLSGIKSKAMCCIRKSIGNGEYATGNPLKAYQVGLYLVIIIWGLPLSFNYPKAKDFLPLIDKVRKKIEGWMTYSLSFVGRIELIKSVLFSTIAYWYFVYKLPNSTVRSLESIFANFLWKGKLHAINWKDICRPKQEGGFGLRKLNDLCHAAALKLIWRLLSTSTLWSNWMRARYAPAHAMDSGTWKLLAGIKPKAMCCIRKSIGNGETTSLWFDPWILEGRLSDILQQINPHLTGTKNWSVSHIIQNSQWHVDLPCLFPIIHHISNIQITGQDDHWIWLPNANGKFTFASAWDQVRTSYSNFDLSNVVWFPSSNPKMACCLIKSLYNRLATRDRLSRFGITSAVECVLCSGGIESRDHLFFQCSFSAYIWNLCKLKLQLDATVINDIRTEALDIQSKFKRKDRTYKLSRMVLSAAVWHIWQERNRRIFHATQLHKLMVFRRLYEDINVLLRTCTWKTGNNTILANWESAETCK
ncbi:uncharacterized protein LOC109839002 [Asparagus officinalis]|uniref:uncharacterized protein LOC109839002 n=1 Tax=Asparagus officinalis TaxID=4686 RepID=UPI00098E51B6|nr:uncharacterized protein LOC109839002 [Asparagus officinalis]